MKSIKAVLLIASILFLLVFFSDMPKPSGEGNFSIMKFDSELKKWSEVKL